ncbi:S8 family peptidase [Chryseobacterium sp. A321]
MEKNLPIKIFQKRRIDERKTEGSGSNTPPKWQLSGSELEERAMRLMEPLEEVFSDFNTRPEERDFIPAALKVDIDDNAIAKSHRKEIQKVFNGRLSKNNIIGFIDSNSLLVKVDSIEEGQQIKQNFLDYTKNAKSISAIQSIEVYKPYITDIEEYDVLKVLLIDYLNYELNNAVKIAFHNFCNSLNLEIKETKYSPGLIIFKVLNGSKAIIDQLSEFEAIEAITFMPKYKVILDDTLSAKDELEIMTPIEGVNYPVIGVLDSGISSNKYLKPWLLPEKFSSYPDDLINPTHGTAVSSIIVYGDKLQKRLLSGSNGCKLFDATVFPDNNKETVYEDELVENVREAIKNNRNIKIWNLSLGTDIDADPNDFSDFGIALDNIQEVYDVIICKSSGNCKNFIQGRPKGKVTKSADSIRCLVVGSIAHVKGENDIAEVNHPSPFTRIGPGPAKSIKPDLVSYGGNAGMNGTRLIQNGVNAIAPDGRIIQYIGTSFATPRVTALLSELHLKISESFNPTLLKALAIHSAKYPEGLTLPVTERIHQMGFGLPDSAENIIYNDPHEITLILQENIVKGEFIEILEFPFPESLVDEDGYFYGEIKVTLVAQPVLREKQGAEYCQSNLEIKLGTYQNIKDRDIEKTNILNEFGPEDAQNILRDSNYKSNFRKDVKSEYARERVLLNYGNKYQPVKKYAVNLDEMTPSNKAYNLESNRKWYVKIIGAYRDFAETLALQDGEVLNQDFTLIITIRDNKRKHPVYNEVSQLLETRNFLHSNIKIREEVRIDTNNNLNN